MKSLASPKTCSLPEISWPETDFEVHKEMYERAVKLFPICRSLTGDGVRQSLRLLQELVPGMVVNEIPTGTQCFDWVIPDEWNIRGAYLDDPNGNRVLDFRDNNLHVLNYSEPVDQEIDLEELQSHLYSSEEQPEAIPYVTSYYKRRWGFCLSHKARKLLVPGRYRAVIDSTLAKGALTYGELLLPGESHEEILLSSYICHPSMANNEVSGPLMLATLGRWLAALPSRRFTYRLVWAPETLGSIAYLSRNIDDMKRWTRAGYVITCVGDDRTYSFLPSRRGNTLADRAARQLLSEYSPGFLEYSFLDRGSDERQYCFPGVDLPVASVMRSKYNTYPEYHTSLDDLSVISAAGLGGAFEVYRKILTALEWNLRFRVTTVCEPRLGIRNLYPDIQRKETSDDVVPILNFLAFADGEHDLLSLSEKIRVPFSKCVELANRLHQAGLLEVVSEIPAGDVHEMH